MDTKYVIKELSKNKDIFSILMDDQQKDLIIWKPLPEKWCLLEIVCHLYDEEREDFRARLKSTLENPGQKFSPIDPGGWVTSRNYMDQNFELKLRDFLSERDRSIDYFESIRRSSMG